MIVAAGGLSNRSLLIFIQTFAQLVYQMKKADDTGGTGVEGGVGFGWM